MFLLCLLHLSAYAQYADLRHSGCARPISQGMKKVAKHCIMKLNNLFLNLRMLSLQWECCTITNFPAFHRMQTVSEMPNVPCCSDCRLHLVLTFLYVM